ncbi:MAG: ASKHA domain-containing protein [Planctomycetaceae bacterium]|nr:ASKHA domain-containing protein [Planctomycetaceae bacterium]
MPTIAFAPSGKSVDVPAGTRLSDACRLAGFTLPTPCGSNGTCGKCRIHVVSGDVPADTRQRNCLSPVLLADGWRASCMAEVMADLTLADPDVDRPEVVLTDIGGRGAEGLGGGLWSVDVVLAKPTKEDQQNDLDRLRKGLADAGMDGADTLVFDTRILTTLPGVLRQNGFTCRVTGLGDRVLAVTGRETECRRLGLAVDLGTTTMAAALCDIDSGEMLAVTSRANPQNLHGDDVISRMDYAIKGAGELEEMRLLALDAIRALADDAKREGGADGDILLAAVGGNTVMNHLLLGIDPGALAVSPFIPCYRAVPPVPASALGWGGQSPLFLIVPNIAAYVGGDITAGIAAHDVADLPGVTLFLDVGTNGEIVLAANGRVYACAAAAGPAFEGARISQGMRAQPGAIHWLDVIDDRLVVKVIGDTAPAKGICGTGLLDAVAALLRIGIVDEGGRMLDLDEAEELGLSADLMERLHEGEDGMAFWLERPTGHGDAGVALTQRDVREFQLAKGAVAAGVKVLLGVAGVTAEGVDRVFLAGGFGSYLRPESAVGVGLLPEGIPATRVEAVGNASLAGTRLYLLSVAERERADALLGRVEYVELSGRDDFQHAFAEEMLFPSG